MEAAPSDDEPALTIRKTSLFQRKQVVQQTGTTYRRYGQSDPELEAAADSAGRKDRRTGNTEISPSQVDTLR